VAGKGSLFHEPGGRRTAAAAWSDRLEKVRPIPLHFWKKCRQDRVFVRNDSGMRLEPDLLIIVYKKNTAYFHSESSAYNIITAHRHGLILERLLIIISLT
jgi:hypothetical protein